VPVTAGPAEPRSTIGPRRVDGGRRVDHGARVGDRLLEHHRDAVVVRLGDASLTEGSRPFHVDCRRQSLSGEVGRQVVPGDQFLRPLRDQREPEPENAGALEGHDLVLGEPVLRSGHPADEFEVGADPRDRALLGRGGRRAARASSVIVTIS